MNPSTVTESIAPASHSTLIATQVEGGLELIDELGDEWRALCDESPSDEPFYRPEWIRAHVRAFFPREKLLMLTVRASGRLVLILPLLKDTTVFCGVPVRRLRNPVNSHSCRFDAVRAPNAEGEPAIRSAWDHLAQRRDWDLLQLNEVPEGSTLAAIVAQAEANQFRAGSIPERPNPIVPVPSDPEHLKKLPINARLRTKLRQIRRELASTGPLKFDRRVTADSAALQRFYELEASGWKGQEKSAVACDPQTRQFYDEIAKTAARFGYFSLYSLEIEGKLLAAHFGLAYKGRYYSPKVAFSEEFKQWSPGHLIVSEILQDCHSRGISCYDITGPYDDWKMKWTDQVWARNTRFIFAKGLRGTAAYQARFWLRPLLKKMLRRKPHTA
ncbi:MAG TPA: GNAT family N-acetyltransferase [Terriglobales bacterium]|nr:GNAT family N-acetyltransferase [Terriglobales bacterium]